MIRGGADGTVNLPANLGGPLEAVAAAFGFETVATPLTAATTTASLPACADWFDLHVDSTPASSAPLTCKVTSVGFPNAVRNGWLQWTRDVERRDGPLRLPVPRGSITRAYCSAPGAIVWPGVVELSGGSSETVHVEATRSVVLRLPADDARPADVRVEVLPDHTRNPAGSPWRADALAWHVRSSHEPWYRTEAAPDGIVVRGVPRDCPLHVFVVDGSASHYSAIEGTEDAIELASAAPTAWSPKRVGDDLGEVVVAAGRLSIGAITALRRDAASGVASRFVAIGKVVDGSLVDPPPAYAPVVTILSDRRGIAWIDWTAAEVPESAWAHGVVEVVPPEGYEVEGELLVRPAWRGMNSVVLGDSVGAIAFPIDTRGGSRRLVRLADGTYTLNGKLRLIDASGRTWSWNVAKQVDVASDAGPTTFPVPRPR